MKVTDLHGYPIEGDLTREVETLPGAVALDLDVLYRGWMKGMTSSITILNPPRGKPRGGFNAIHLMY